MKAYIIQEEPKFKEKERDQYRVEFIQFRVKDPSSGRLKLDEWVSSVLDLL